MPTSKGNLLVYFLKYYYLVTHKKGLAFYLIDWIFRSKKTKENLRKIFGEKFDPKNFEK